MDGLTFGFEGVEGLVLLTAVDVQLVVIVIVEELNSVLGIVEFIWNFWWASCIASSILGVSCVRALLLSCGQV